MAGNIGRAFGLAIFALAVAACGGGSGSGSTSGAGTGGTNAFSQGQIQRFGSIFVNGVEWRTKGATLRTPDDSTTTQQLSSETEIRGRLAEGEVVRVKGTLDADGKGGQATEIEYHRSLEGRVTSRSVSSFDVNGVRVTVDASTHHKNAAGADDSFGGMAVGQRVQVSGAADDKGGLRASSVRILASASAELEVKGYLLAAPSGGSFQLALTPGGAAFLSVDASGATLPSGLAAGSFVEVRGTSVAAGTPPTLTATSVSIEDTLRGEAQNEAEVEGIVTDGTAAAFTVAGQKVTTSASTTWVGAADPSNPTADFAVGGKVEAEGTLDASGVLAARKVKFKDSARLGGTLSALVLSGTAPIVATFTVLGKTVMTAVDTRFENVTVTTLASDQFVEVRGYPQADGTILAQRVTLVSGGNNRAFVVGVVSAKAPPSLTVLGFSVNTTGAELHGEDEAVLGQAAFFDAITAGSTLVKVRWNGADTTAAVKEVEIEAKDG